jgi:hypothetical protein
LFPTDQLEPKQFSIFLDLIRCRESNQFSREQEFGFLSVCKLLGNEELSLIFLSSIHWDPTSECAKSDHVLSGSSVDYGDCASQFGSYSTEGLRSVSKETLHKILSSESLRIESEDFLLQRLIDLGSSYFEYWCYLEVSFLSDEGISQFVEVLPFDDLSELIWSKIVYRLKGICDSEFRSRRYCHRHTSNRSVFESTIIPFFLNH